MPDNTDFLPYKAHLHVDEDMQKPIEVLAELLSQYWGGSPARSGDRDSVHTSVYTLPNRHGWLR